MPIGLGIPSLVVLPKPAGAGAVFWWGNDGVSSATNDRYMTPGYEGGNAPLASGTRQRFRIPRAGTLRNMYVEHNGVGGGGNLIVYTMHINGVATALAVSIAASAATGSNLVDTVAVVAGDQAEIIVTKVANLGGSPSNVVVSAELG